VIRTEDYRPCAITENYRCVPATRGEVQRGGLYFRTDHEDGLVHACFYELVGDRQGVDESGAGVADIQRGYAFDAEFTLKQYTGSRKEIVRGNGGEYNKVNLLCFDPRILHCHMSCFGRHVGNGVLRRVDEPAFMDTRSLNDPLVVGVYDRRKIFVSDNGFRYMMAKAHNLRVSHLFTSFL